MLPLQAAVRNKAGAEGWDPLAAASKLRDFLGFHGSVYLREAGRRVALLNADTSGFSISTETGKLVCHFWSPEANLVRRVVGVVGEADSPRLRLNCLRMGRAQPEPLWLEPETKEQDIPTLVREEFLRAVIATAEREWPGWSYEPPGTGRASPRSGVQRFLFRRGRSLLPCIAVNEQESATTAATALPQALVWIAQLRLRHPGNVIAALRLILPPGAEAQIAHRRRWLRAPPLAPALECYHFDRAAGQLNLIPVSDYGNLASSLRRATGPLVHPNAIGEEAAALLAEMREICPQMTLEVTPDGNHAFHLYGLECARQTTGAEALVANFSFGYGRERSLLQPATRPLFCRFLRDLGAQRVAGRDRRDPFYALQPERWMEHLLRSDLSSLDPQIDRRFVYSQVPVCLPGQRDVLDLLAADRSGRLVVLELKAEENVGFPLQALDYWLRVRHHQQEGDFERLGYFPGVELSPLPPRLWLVAPALRWHPQTEAVLTWLVPEVPWTRIGINEEWRHGIQVLYRKESSHA